MIYIHPTVSQNPLRIAQLMESTGMVALFHFKLNGQSVGRLINHSQGGNNK